MQKSSLPHIASLSRRFLNYTIPESVYVNLLASGVKLIKSSYLFFTESVTLNFSMVSELLLKITLF